MSKKDKPPKPEPVPQPSEPIKEKDKDKKQKNKDKLKGAKHLENVDIDADGSITAGTWVAEFDKSSIRKSKLRQ